MYSCVTCKKIYSCERALNRHLTSKGHLLRESKEKNMHTCQCGKSFAQCAGLSRHKKQCSVYLSNTKPISLKDQMEKMKKEFTKERESYLKKIQELTDQISCLQEKQSSTHICLSVPNTKTRRRKITPFLRSKIKESQNHACNICSLPLSEYFQIDHMIALQYGGTDDEQNLQALCCECHAKKSIIENKKRESIKKAIDFIINQEISESPDPRIQNSM